MAITITDEMRQAVHAEDCERNGHLVDLTNMFERGQGTGRGNIRSSDGSLPHIVCTHCGATFIVDEVPAPDYAAAEKQFNDRLLPAHRQPPRKRAPRTADH